ncbi:MAG: hypothetical protein M1155_01470 [Patescibacteria group bacterium]|nr:hypothetical protein [Patescibacteria group bacterium]
MKNNRNKYNNGQVMMIVVMVLSGVIVGAASIAGLLTARQTRQTADFGSSGVAEYAADAGLEWRVYKLYEDWKAGNLTVDNGCFDCNNGVACDKKPDFVDNPVKINNVDVKDSVTCTALGLKNGYLYFNINSIGNVQDVSFSFSQVIKFAQ